MAWRSARRTSSASAGAGRPKAPGEEAARKEIQAALGGKAVDWLSVMPLKSDLGESVKDDVGYLRDSPYIKDNAVITGWVYDTVQGKIEQVV